MPIVMILESPTDARCGAWASGNAWLTEHYFAGTGWCFRWLTRFTAWTTEPLLYYVGADRLHPALQQAIAPFLFNQLLLA